MCFRLFLICSPLFFPSSHPLLTPIPPSDLFLSVTQGFLFPFPPPLLPDSTCSPPASLARRFTGERLYLVEAGKAWPYFFIFVFLKSLCQLRRHARHFDGIQPLLRLNPAWVSSTSCTRLVYVFTHCLPVSLSLSHTHIYTHFYPPCSPFHTHLNTINPL